MSFFIGVELLYNVVIVSAVQKSKSAVCIHIFSSSLASLPPNPHSTPLGHHGILYYLEHILLDAYIFRIVLWCMLSRVRLFATPWTVALQATLSIEFSRQE